MPLVRSMTVVAFCDFCPATEACIAGTGAPLPEIFFAAHHWELLDDTTVACPRCAPLLKTVTRRLKTSLRKLERAHA